MITSEQLPHFNSSFAERPKLKAKRKASADTPISSPTMSVSGSLFHYSQSSSPPTTTSSTLTPPLFSQPHFPQAISSLSLADTPEVGDEGAAHDSRGGGVQWDTAHQTKKMKSRKPAAERLAGARFRMLNEKVGVGVGVVAAVVMVMVVYVSLSLSLCV